MVELAGGLLHLLTQEMERREYFAARLVGVELDVVSDRVRRPERIHAARLDQFFVEYATE